MPECTVANFMHKRLILRPNGYLTVCHFGQKNGRDLGHKRNNKLIALNPTLFIAAKLSNKKAKLGDENYRRDFELFETADFSKRRAHIYENNEGAARSVFGARE